MYLFLLFVGKSGITIWQLGELLLAAVGCFGVPYGLNGNRWAYGVGLALFFCLVLLIFGV